MQADSIRSLRQQIGARLNATSELEVKLTVSDKAGGMVVLEDSDASFLFAKSAAGPIVGGIKGDPNSPLRPQLHINTNFGSGSGGSEVTTPTPQALSPPISPNAGGSGSGSEGSNTGSPISYKPPLEMYKREISLLAEQRDHRHDRITFTDRSNDPLYTTVHGGSFVAGIQ